MCVHELATILSICGCDDAAKWGNAMECASQQGELSVLRMKRDIRFEFRLLIVIYYYKLYMEGLELKLKYLIVNVAKRFLKK